MFLAVGTHHRRHFASSFDSMAQLQVAENKTAICTAFWAQVALARFFCFQLLISKLLITREAIHEPHGNLTVATRD